MKSKKSTNIILALFLIILAVGLGYFLTLRNGNLLTKVKVKNSAKEYIQTEYPEFADKFIINMDDVIYFPEYEDDTGHYDAVWQVHFSDKDLFNTGIDYFFFDLVYDTDGNLISDGYKNCYLKGYTVYFNADISYNTYVEKLFIDEFKDNPDFDVENGIYGDYASGNMIDEDKYNSHIEYTGPYFDPTIEHDFMDIAKDYGYIGFMFKDDSNKCPEDLYEKRCIARDFIEKYDIPVKEVSVFYNFMKTFHFEGVQRISKDDLFSDYLKQIIIDNYEK